MHDTMHTQYYRPHMVNVVYGTVKGCTSCRRKCQTRKQQRKLWFFPAKELLVYIVIDVFVPVQKTKSGNQYIDVITYWISKQTETIQTAKTTATKVAAIFLEHWVSNSGIPTKLPTNNGPQLASKFLAAIYTVLGVNNITTTEYHTKHMGRSNTSTE